MVSSAMLADRMRATIGATIPHNSFGLVGFEFSGPAEGTREVPPLTDHRLIVNRALVARHDLWRDGRLLRTAPSMTGALRIAPPGETTRFAVNADRLAFSQVFFSPGMLQAVRPRAKVIDPGFEQVDALSSELTTALLNAGAAPADRLYVDHLALALLSRLAARFAWSPIGRTVRPFDRQKTRIVLEMIDHAIGGSITVADLAVAIGLSPAHFTRAFIETFDVPPHVFLTRRRMQRAQMLLSGDERDLLGVAMAVGYQSHSAFSAAFRRHVGISPSAWRAEHNGPRIATIVAEMR